MIVFNTAIILCQITEVKINVFQSKFCVGLRSTEVSDYRGSFLQVLLNDILVRLERILDYVGVGLERFDCQTNSSEISKLFFPNQSNEHWYQVFTDVHSTTQQHETVLGTTKHVPLYGCTELYNYHACEQITNHLVLQIKKIFFNYTLKFLQLDK